MSVPDSWGRTFPEYPHTPREEAEWVPKYDLQRVQGGDLILEEDETLIIENRTYILDGLLLVKDNARLILRNAELYIKEKGSWSSRDILPHLVYIGFNDSAVFEAYNCSVFSEDIFPFMGFFGDSRAFLNSSRFDSVSMYGGEDSYVVIRNSSLNRINVARNARCKVIDSEIVSIHCYSILDELYWSQPQRIWERCSVELWNSTLEGIGMMVENCEASISRPLMGFYRYWSPYEYFAGEGVVAFNVTLHDTNLTGEYWSVNVISGSLRLENTSDVAGIQVQNGTLLMNNMSMGYVYCSDSLFEITNSSIRIMRCTGDSKTYIDGSNMWWFIIEGGVEADVSRSKAELLVLEGFNGTARFDTFLVEEIELGGKIKAYVEGSVRFAENATGEEFFSGNGFIIRNFEVLALGENRVLPNVRLTLYDKDDNAVWSGQTDKNGEASFNITFCKLWPLYEQFKYVNNYEDQWRLEAASGEVVSNATVGLFTTETPIVFTFPSAPEPPFWRQRWLLSAVSATTISAVLIGLLIYYFYKPR
ncbi:MAG: hypothetical protein HWN71_04035 [Desulfobacterales bacterium]|nr:hypothetical protein [Desulfobacterales bacterium]